jgi:hypothetical protein
VCCSGTDFSELPVPGAGCSSASVIDVLAGVSCAFVCLAGFQLASVLLLHPDTHAQALLSCCAANIFVADFPHSQLAGLIRDTHSVGHGYNVFDLFLYEQRAIGRRTAAGKAVASVFLGHVSFVMSCMAVPECSCKLASTRTSWGVSRHRRATATPSTKPRHA